MKYVYESSVALIISYLVSTALLKLTIDNLHPWTIPVKLYEKNCKEPAAEVQRCALRI